MEEVIRENNKFIRITDNQKGWQKLSGDLTLRVGPIIKRIISLSVTGGVNRYISEGNSYSHTYNNWYYRASVMAMYKKFMAMFQIQSSYNTFVANYCMVARISICLCSGTIKVNSPLEPD